MEKPNLVIDREQEKVFLDGEVVAHITNNNINRIGDFEVEISRSQIDKYPMLKLFDFYENDVACLCFPVKDKFFSSQKWMSNLTIRFYDSRKILLYFYLNFEEWKFSFSFNIFLEKLQNILKNHTVIKVDTYDFNTILEDGFYFTLSLNQKNSRIGTMVHYVLKEFKSILNNIVFELSQENNSSQNNLTNTFTFPSEIQSSCEQYLIYFATFLKDIGINAETNIESKAHKTLFTVIPKDGEEALDKIKEALQMYLSLPESPEFETVASEFTDVGVQQLASQVYFLKSQLLMANSAIQMKDATIQSLNMTNYQQTRIIESHQTKEKNEEEIAGGLVKANEVKVIGLTFDLPELLRRIKRKFKM